MNALAGSVKAGLPTVATWLQAVANLSFLLAGMPAILFFILIFFFSVYTTFKNVQCTVCINEKLATLKRLAAERQARQQPPPPPTTGAPTEGGGISGYAKEKPAAGAAPSTF